MLTVRIDDNIALLTLNHPEIGNSFGTEEAAILSKTLKSKDLRGIVLTGEGSRFFCTGGNLSAQAKAKNAKEALKQQKKIRLALGALAKFDKPTVAIVNGDAFGGGLELLSAFDYVISKPHCLFGFWQRKLGLTYGWGGGSRLLSRLGEAKLRRLTLEATQFSAREALSKGLVDEILPEPFVQTFALKWIEAALKNPSYGDVKTWSPREEFKIFDKLWMNERHKETVNRHKR